MSCDVPSIAWCGEFINQDCFGGSLSWLALVKWNILTGGTLCAVTVEASAVADCLIVGVVTPQTGGYGALNVKAVIDDERYVGLTRVAAVTLAVVCEEDVFLW